MSDIVTRLRMRPTIVRSDQFGSLETDRAATKLFDDVHALMREAADEIDRLRADLAQRTAEVAALKAERERRFGCVGLSRIRDAMRFAEEFGWDCFEKKEKL